MYFFLIKKTFFDMWDNFPAILLMSIGFILLICGFFILPSLLKFPTLLFYPYTAFGVVVISFYNGAMYRLTLDFSDFKKGGLLLFFKYFIQSWKLSLVNAVLSLALVVVILYVIPFYFSADAVILLILGAITFWTWFTVFLAGLFFFPAAIRLKKKLLPSLRFSFAFVMDNTVFSLFTLLLLIAIAAVSVLILFLIPGMGTVFLWINVCFKTRVYKYYYLESHPGADRKNIPWDELIAADVAAVGKRSLRGIMFPWKQ